jgi:hypothetical protein
MFPFHEMPALTVRSPILLLLQIALLLALVIPQNAGYASMNNGQAILTSQAPGDIGWKGSFLINGNNTSGRAVAADGNRIYMAGDFTAAGDSLMNSIAMWDGTSWSTLKGGLNNTVNALACDGRGHLYAGGFFTAADGKPASHIARWDGLEWQPLGAGVNANVWAIAVDGQGNVYAGGQFNSAGGLPANGIAKWDGTTWSTLGEGTWTNSLARTGWVYALTFDQFGFLYAAGAFSQAGDSAANNIARWDGLAWTALGDGISGDPYSATVYALASDGHGNVYAGGLFTTAGTASTANLARWNGETWSEVGGGVQAKEQVKAAVTSLIANGSDLYVGGLLISAGGVVLGGIARWNGSTWDNLQGGFWQEDYDPFVAAMTINRDGKIFATGRFSLAGGNCAKNMAVWSGTEWHGLGADTSVDGFVSVMISDHTGGYYVAGDFTCAGGLVVNHIAHWNGTAWSGLGEGIQRAQFAVQISTLVEDSNGSLYLAGSFSQAGGLPVNNIARWNGSEWQALGAGLNNHVTALVVDSQNNLFAGGAFPISNGMAFPYVTVVKWSNSQWENIGVGFDNSVTALAVDSQNRLIAGGYFSTAGGVTANGLARWDGQTWSAIIDRNIAPANFLISTGDTLYGGGYSLWKIQDGIFETIGSGFSNLRGFKIGAQTLAFDSQGRLVVGGDFAYAGVTPANNIARWDRDHWEALGSGVDSTVSAVLVDSSGKLTIAGGFGLAGGKVSQNLAEWIDPGYFWLPILFK